MEELHKIPEELLGKKREDYLPLETTFMLTAQIWAARSKDPSTQVGACYVNEAGKIISVGYNGTPNNWDDQNFPWSKNTGDIKNDKYPYVIHAEMNAVTNHDGLVQDFRNSTLYVTLFPCTNCAKLLIQLGVKKVIYLSDFYRQTDDVKSSKLLLQNCGVEVIEYDSIKGELTGVEVNLDSEGKEPVKIRKRSDIPFTAN